MRDGATRPGVTPSLTSEGADFDMAESNLPRKGPRVHDIGVVYGLVSAEEPDRIRYVGFTSRALSERMKSHRAEARKGLRKSVSVWFAQQIAAGVEVWAVVLMTNATYADEIATIAAMRAEGAGLLNETAGGPGLNGMKATPAMMAAARRPASEKQKAAVRAFNATRDYSSVAAKNKAHFSKPEVKRRVGAAISAAIARKDRALLAAEDCPTEPKQG